MSPTPEDLQAMAEEAFAPILHEYRMGIETLIFAWMAQRGLGFRDFDIRTETKGRVIKTWIERKVV